MRWLKAIMALLMISGLLLALVASHGCDVEGSSPSQPSSSQPVEK